MEEAVKEIKEIFCSDFQKQILKIIYNNFVLKDTNLRIFLSRKIYLYCAANNMHEIPSYVHLPPQSKNPLFENFKLEFCESISQREKLYEELAKVIPQINSLPLLTLFIENMDRTELMLKSRAKDMEKQQTIKTQNQNQHQNVKNFSTQEPKPCWNYQAGNCAYSNNCHFSHNKVKNKKKVQFSGNNNNDRPSCARCGHYSHQEENCQARTHRNGSALPNPSINEISENESLGVYLQDDSEDDSDSEGEICTLQNMDFESDNSFQSDHLKLLGHGFKSHHSI